MPDAREDDREADVNRPTVYQIRITGQLGPRWADWFEGLDVALDGDDTLLTGPVADQAALHGLLRRVRDLGLPLVSVTPVGSGSEAGPRSGAERPRGRPSTRDDRGR